MFGYAEAASELQAALRPAVPESEYRDEPCLSKTARRTLQRMAAWQDQHLPEFATRTWFQMRAAERVRFCKPLPDPESFLLSREERREAADLLPKAKRRKLEAAAKEQYEPDRLHDLIWRKLDLTNKSLGACRRPGRGFR